MGTRTEAEWRTLLNVEDGADVTAQANVISALSTSAAAKDLGGGALLNVAAITDDGIFLPATRNVWTVYSGTWSDGLSAGDGLSLQRAPAAAQHYLIGWVPLKLRTAAGKGLKPSRFDWYYEIADEAATDLFFQAKLMNASGAIVSSANYGGLSNDTGDGLTEYDSGHDDISERCAIGDHKAIITPPSDAYINTSLGLFCVCAITGAASTTFTFRGLEVALEASPF